MGPHGGFWRRLNQRVKFRAIETAAYEWVLADPGEINSLTTDLGVRGSTPLGRANLSRAYEIISNKQSAEISDKEAPGNRTGNTPA